jgi:hypothetical protein
MNDAGNEVQGKAVDAAPNSPYGNEIAEQAAAIAAGAPVQPSSGARPDEAPPVVKPGPAKPTTAVEPTIEETVTVTKEEPVTFY